MPPVKHKNAHRKKTPLPKTPSSLAFTAPVSAQSSLSSRAATDTADQLHSAAIHLLRRLRVRDRESGIGPAQLSALSVLVFGGPRSLGELADAEQVRPPTMSRIVAGLHRSALVRRHATEDGRRVRLEATPKGVSLMWEGRKRRVESLANAIEGLRESERQQLSDTIALLQQIIRSL
jgi:DNA-binding MarR family transcriptional regulator